MADEKNKSDKAKFLLLGVILVGGLAGWIWLVPKLLPDPGKKLAWRVICSNNMYDTGQALEEYALHNNDKLPPAENWREILINEKLINPEKLKCPADSNGFFSYGLNSNLADTDYSTLEPNTVVLFESSGVKAAKGANKVLTNRHEPPGSNIYFKAGAVVYIYSKDIEGLNWYKPEKSD